MPRIRKTLDTLSEIIKNGKSQFISGFPKTTGTMKVTVSKISGNA